MTRSTFSPAFIVLNAVAAGCLVLALLLNAGAYPVPALAAPPPAALLPDPLDTLQGSVNIQWGDPQPGRTDPGQVFYFLIDDLDRSIRLQFAGGVPLPHAGQRVQLEGRWSAAGGSNTSGDAPAGVTVFLVQSLQGVPASPARLEVTGPQPWVSVLCKFADVPGEPQTLSYFQGMYANVFPGLDHYWREISYNLGASLKNRIGS